MQTGRRLFLQGSLALSLLVALPARLLAAAWPEAAFRTKSIEDALKELYGSGSPTPSPEVSLKAPEIAQDGRVVPVTVTTTLAGVQSIGILVEKNPVPLVASFELAANAVPSVETRIKMGQTSTVLAVVKTSSGLFSASKDVKVTIGGCGG